jgi:hypothetical protein
MRTRKATRRENITIYLMTFWVAVCPWIFMWASDNLVVNAWLDPAWYQTKTFVELTGVAIWFAGIAAIARFGDRL